MAQIGEPQSDAETRALRRRLRELEAHLAAVGNRSFLADGSRPLAGPLQHAGSTVGFFNANPQAKVATTPATLADVIAVLQHYGLVP